MVASNFEEAALTPHCRGECKYYPLRDIRHNSETVLDIDMELSVPYGFYGGFSTHIFTFHFTQSHVMCIITGDFHAIIYIFLCILNKMFTRLVDKILLFVLLVLPYFYSCFDRIVILR